MGTADHDMSFEASLPQPGSYQLAKRGVPAADIDELPGARQAMHGHDDIAAGDQREASRLVEIYGGEMQIGVAARLEAFEAVRAVDIGRCRDRDPGGSQFDPSAVGRNHSSLAAPLVGANGKIDTFALVRA